MVGRFPSKARKRPPQDLLEKLTICLFFVGIALCVTHTLWADDVWWHLKTGEWIFRHHTVPRQDLFSYTVSDHPWIDLSWGFQLLIYLFYSVWGIPGIILFKVAVVTFTFFLLFLFFHRRLPLWILLLILTTTLFAAHDRLVERPEVLSFFFLVVTLLLLEKDRQKQTKWLYFLPFLQLLWVNTHGGLSVLGLLLVGTSCLSDLTLWLSSKEKDFRFFPWRTFVIGGAVCTATLINPYGLEGSLFPRILFGRISGSLKVFSLNIGEFLSPFAAPEVTLRAFLYKGLLVSVPFCFLLNRRRVCFFHVVTYLFFAFLSVLAKRNAAPFSFIACFLILANLEATLFKTKADRFSSRTGPSGRSLFLLLPLTLLLPVPFLTHTFYLKEEGFHKRFGLGISEHRYCIEAARFIEKTDLPGNFFNSGLEIGDYLVWHLSPRRKVFVDGRLEVYGGVFLGELLNLLENPPLWPSYVERYQINFCILDHLNPRHDALLLWLVHSSQWRPIYLDGGVVIFMKKAAGNRKILAAHAIDLTKDPLPSDSGDWTTEVGLAEFYTKVGLPDKAESLYRRGLAFHPPIAMVYHNFGNILRSRWKTEEALSAYRQAVRLNPKEALFHYGLGDLYVSLGKDDLALREFKESTKLSPHFGELYYKLGRLYEKKEQIKEAEKAYGSVEVSNSRYLDARNALGVLYAKKGEFEKAEREFKGILKINPNAKGTVQNLRTLGALRRKKEGATQK